MHIGLDFDDTLLDTRRAFLAVLNRVFATDHQCDLVGEFSFRKLFDCTQERVFDLFIESFDEIHGVDPFPGVQVTLKELTAQGHRLTIITARPAIHMPPLPGWLKRHGIHVDHVISAPSAGDKAQHAVRERLDIFVEDSPKHALSVAAAGVRVLLMDRLYNRECQDPNMTRVRDWKDISEILLAGEANVPVAETPAF
jgi:uncharacterized protein